MELMRLLNGIPRPKRCHDAAVAPRKLHEVNEAVGAWVLAKEANGMAE